VTRAAFDKEGRPTGRAYLIPARDVRRALAGLGPRDGWNDHARRASAGHAADIVAVYRFAQAAAAGSGLDLRVQLFANGANGAVPQPLWGQANKQLVGDYEDLVRVIDPTLKAAERLSAPGASDPLPKTARYPLVDFANRLPQLHNTMILPATFNRVQFNTAMDVERAIGVAFGRYRAQARLPGDFVQDMLKDLEYGVQGRVRFRLDVP
jgi:hypothetical protein